MKHKITKHFSYEDCVCPCCDCIKIVPGFYKHMIKLEKVRQKLGFPIIINSGYRCLIHNRELESKDTSWHRLFATDVRPEWGKGFTQRLRQMYRVALIDNWGGIGYYTTFLHLDMRTKSARWRG